MKTINVVVKQMSFTDNLLFLEATVDGEVINQCIGEIELMSCGDNDYRFFDMTSTQSYFPCQVSSSTKCFTNIPKNPSDIVEAIMGDKKKFLEVFFKNWYEHKYYYVKVMLKERNLYTWYLVKGDYGYEFSTKPEIKPANKLFIQHDKDNKELFNGAYLVTLHEFDSNELPILLVDPSQINELLENPVVEISGNI